MAQDFESLLKELIGEPLAEQKKRFMAKVQEMARDVMKDELSRMEKEIADLRARLTRLEQERAEAAADTTTF